MISFLTEANRVKQSSSAAVAFRRTVGLHTLEQMETQGHACQLALTLWGQDMRGLGFQVESNCWQDTVSMSS